ncbi:hypothetical protein PT2222_50289 [Paraburkholderia tropica]
MTGRYSNQLNYRSNATITDGRWLTPTCCLANLVDDAHVWRPLGDSNPCTHRERVMS